MTDEPWKAELKRAAELRTIVINSLSNLRFADEKIARALVEVRAEERENIAKWLENQTKEMQKSATIGTRDAIRVVEIIAAAIRGGKA